MNTGAACNPVEHRVIFFLAGSKSSVITILVSQGGVLPTYEYSTVAVRKTVDVSSL